MSQYYTIYLHGLLKKEFTSDAINIYAINIQEAFEGLCSRFGHKFKTTILEGSWHITEGKRNSEELASSDNFIFPEMLQFPIKSTELHVFPAIVGSGGKGIGQIILGVVLIIGAIVLSIVAPPAGGTLWGFTATEFGTTSATLALAGIMSIAGGVMNMLTKNPSTAYGSSITTDQKLSFIFNGTVNNTEQGVPIPLIYGRHLTGSTIISAGIDVEQIA
jgi:predicted phage tail protein